MCSLVSWLRLSSFGLLMLTAAVAVAGSEGGARILDYLHGRGEAVDMTAAAASPIKAVYADYRDSECNHNVSAWLTENMRRPSILSFPSWPRGFDHAVSWSRPDTTIRAMADAGYNVIIMAFYLSSSGAVDFVGAWTTAIGDAERAAAVAYAHSKGAILLMSVGGTTDSSWPAKNATAFGHAVGDFAVSMRMDGVDFDLENLNAGCTVGTLTAAQTVTWMAQASIATRQAVGAAGFVTHAPQAPYFGPIAAGSTAWAGPTGCYSGVAAQAKWTPPGATADVPAIDWYFAQYYNQGGTCYTTYEGIFTRSAADCAVFPGTSVAEIASYGVPRNSIVVGKYLLDGVDGSNGFVSAANLYTYLGTARASLGYDGGVMCWAWQAAGSPSWIATIYPVTPAGGSPSPAAAVTASTTPVAPSPSAAASSAVSRSPSAPVPASASRTNTGTRSAAAPSSTPTRTHTGTAVASPTATSSASRRASASESASGSAAATIASASPSASLTLTGTASGSAAPTDSPSTPASASASAPASVTASASTAAAAAGGGSSGGSGASGAQGGGGGSGSSASYAPSGGGGSGGSSSGGYNGDGDGSLAGIPRAGVAGIVVALALLLAVSIGWASYRLRRTRRSRAAALVSKPTGRQAPSLAGSTHGDSEAHTPSASSTSTASIGMATSPLSQQQRSANGGNTANDRQLRTQAVLAGSPTAAGRSAVTNGVSRPSPRGAVAPAPVQLQLAAIAPGSVAGFRAEFAPQSSLSASV